MLQGTFAKKLTKSMVVFIGLIPMLLCDNGTSPPSTRPLELIFPRGGGGQTFKVGDTVTIKWKINDLSKVNDVGISYSLDGGKTVTGTQIIGNGSIAYPDTSYRWIITDRFVSDSFVLIIWEYKGQCLNGSPSCDSPSDKSAPFRIVR